MKREPRIGVFYSKGRNLVDVLRSVRSRYPQGHLAVFIPPGYVLSAEETACIDESIVTEHSVYSLRRPDVLLGLRSQLRCLGRGIFVVMFDTPKQRILAAVSGTEERLYFDMNRRLIPLRASIPSVLLGALARNIWGRLVYAGIWILVRITRVGKTA